LEGLFSHQDARVDVPDSLFSPPTRLRITVDQWLVGGLQEFDVEGPTRPFFDALVGLTRYATQGDSEIRFAVGAGGGVKLRPHRHIGARLDGRVFLTLADLGGSAVFCRPGLCLAGLHADVVWQAEFSAGLNVVF